MPAGEPVHERVDVPEPPVIDVDDKVQTRFVELVVSARVTTPVKPFSPVTVAVDVPAIPTLGDTIAGLAATVKSCMWYVTVAECERVPLVPVTVAR